MSSSNPNPPRPQRPGRLVSLLLDLSTREAAVQRVEEVGAHFRLLTLAGEQLKGATWTPGAARTAQAAAPVMVSAKPSASAQTKAAALSASDRTTALKALEEGRKKSRAKDFAGALSAFDRALALRDNAEVKRRLDGVSGSGAPAAPSCDAGAPSIEALCKCLLGLPETPMVISDQKPVCSARPSSLSPGSPRLSIVRYGAPEDDAGERVNLLVAEDGGVFRPVTELGRDYMPGAFGVHNTATVLGGEARSAGSRSVIVIKSELRNYNQNMAGLEVCSESVNLETVCALSAIARDDFGWQQPRHRRGVGHRHLA